VIRNFKRLPTAKAKKALIKWALKRDPHTPGGLKYPCPGYPPLEQGEPQIRGTHGPNAAQMGPSHQIPRPPILTLGVFFWGKI